MAELLKVIEVLAESEKSWEDAAAEAVKRAAKTLKNIRSIYAYPPVTSGVGLAWKASL